MSYTPSRCSCFDSHKAIWPETLKGSRDTSRPLTGSLTAIFGNQSWRMTPRTILFGTHFIGTTFYPLADMRERPKAIDNRKHHPRTTRVPAQLDYKNDHDFLKKFTLANPPKLSPKASALHLCSLPKRSLEQEPPLGLDSFPMSLSLACLKTKVCSVLVFTTLRRFNLELS